MIKIKSTIFIASAALGLLMVGSSAFATLLPPGGTVTPNATSLTGLILADSVKPFSFAGDTGTMEESVVQSTSGNPFGAGDLSFLFQVSVSTGVVEHLTDTSFAGFSTDAMYDATAGGASYVNGNDAPTEADRAVDGSVVSFDFPGAAGITSTTGPSYTLIINTNALFYQPGTVGLIDGGGETLPGYEPAVPEPATAMVALVGLPLLARRRSMRR